MDGIRINKLKLVVKNYSRIVIYGAGEIAEKWYMVLAEHDMLPEYCIVTSKKDEEERFKNIPLHSIQECVYDLQRKDTVILAAVSAVYEKEIRDVLKSYNINNYFFVSAFLGKIVSYENYRDKSRDEYLSQIAEWYVEEHELDQQQMDAVKHKIASMVNKENNSSDLLFVIGNLSPRIIKILNALRRKQYKIRILFCPNVNINLQDLFYQNMIDSCDSYCLCKCIEELMYEIILSRVKVVHIFSHMGTTSVAQILLQRKELFPKIVFDQYDIINGMHPFVSDVWMEAERYCLENADGLCCRACEQDYLMEKEIIHVKGKIIKFFDYCGGSSIKCEERKGKEEELSLCYAGGVSTERENAGPVACWLEFARMCEENQCHFHMYPAIWNEKRYEDYIELSEKSHYFHLHKPVLYENLGQELSQYDYGIQPIRSEFREREINGRHTRNKYIFGTSNHYYDYLDAGLPIIAAHPVKFVRYLEKKGVLFNWTIEEFDFDQLKQRRNEMKQNVLKVRNELSVQNHIDELIEFYQSL